jgi:hypothetical protein
MLRFCTGKRRRRRSQKSLSKDLDDIERTTDIFIPDTTMSDEFSLGLETIIIDNHQCKGTTARFNAQGDIFPLRTDLQLEG